MTAFDFDVRPVAGRIGAEIIGVDIADDLDDATVAQIREALLIHRVVFFREQNLDAAGQVRFGEHFAEVTSAHPTVPAIAGHDQVLDIRYEAGGSRANRWHSDVTFVGRPPLASILRAIVTPPYGGDTVWANTVAGYQDLPRELRDLADSLWAEHSNEFDYSTVSGTQETSDKFASVFASEVFRTRHPVVQVHPETGERALLIGGFVRSIEGFSTIDGARVLDILQDSVSKIENTVRWTWAPGDVAFWDNRTTQHYGVADYGDLARHHQRITLAGGVPVSVDGESSVALVGDDSAFTPVG